MPSFICSQFPKKGAEFYIFLEGTGRSFVKISCFLLDFGEPTGQFLHCLFSGVVVEWENLYIARQVDQACRFNELSEFATMSCFQRVAMFFEINRG